MRKRRCAAPGCRRRFSPHVSKQGRQRYCSNTCRQRAFYWTFKESKGMRYAEAQQPRPSRKGRSRKAASRTSRARPRRATRRR